MIQNGANLFSFFGRQTPLECAIDAMNVNSVIELLCYGAMMRRRMIRYAESLGCKDIALVLMKADTAFARLNENGITFNYKKPFTQRDCALRDLMYMALSAAHSGEGLYNDSFNNFVTIETYRKKLEACHPANKRQEYLLKCVRRKIDDAYSEYIITSDFMPELKDLGKQVEAVTKPRHSQSRFHLFQQTKASQ